MTRPYWSLLNPFESFNSILNQFTLIWTFQPILHYVKKARNHARAFQTN